MGLLGLVVFFGCQDPPNIIQATPPGVAPPAPILPAGSEAEAIGETKLSPPPTPKDKPAPGGTTAVPAPASEPATEGSGPP